MSQTSALKLGGLEKLDKLNDKVFKELPPALQLSFPRRSIRVTALSDKADPDVRFEIFDRLNRGGIVLTPQEVRACIYRGAYSEMLRDLGEDTTFNTLVKLQESEKNDGYQGRTCAEILRVLERSEFLSWEGNVVSERIHE